MADACSALDWSFLGSAASQSTFAGVASGFVFAAICVLVADGTLNENTTPLWSSSPRHSSFLLSTASSSQALPGSTSAYGPMHPFGPREVGSA
jgi:hypothetical protein